MEQPAGGARNGRRGGVGLMLSLSQRLVAGLVIGVLTTLGLWVFFAWVDSLTPDSAGFDATRLLFVLLSVVPGLGLGWAVLRSVDRRVADLAVYATALAKGLPARERTVAGGGALADLTTGLNEIAARLEERERQVRELGEHASRLDAPLREAAAQEERNRLARELHDTIKQQLFSIGVTAAAAEARWEGDPAGARAAVGEIRALAGEAQVEMRALLTQLRPAPVATIGLLAALREQLDALAYRAEVEVAADLRPLPEGASLAPGAEDALFRIAQEGLANIARHARARRVWASFGLVDDPLRGESVVELRLRDDGAGFDPGAAQEGEGMGVRNMRDRAAGIAGELAIGSRAGRGTELVVRVPLYRAPAVIEDKEGIPVEVKESSLSNAAIMRIISSSATVTFFWAMIVVNRLEGLPDWIKLVALGLLSMSFGTGIAAEALARHFRRQVGDAPEWRARLDRIVALTHMIEYMLSALLVPEMARVIFDGGRFVWVGDLIGLSALLFAGAAIWAGWELVQAEIALTGATGRRATRAALVQERTRQITNLSMNFLLLFGVAAFAPGQVTFFPDGVADVIRTSLVGVLGVLGAVAGWQLIVAAVRLRRADDGGVVVG